MVLKPGHFGEDHCGRSCEKRGSIAKSNGTEEQKINRKANWISNILRRNCILKHNVQGMIEGWTEVPERQGRKCK